MSCVHPTVQTDKGESLRTITVKPTPARIERGRYLANHVAACLDCHSRRDWTRLAGPIKSGTLGAGGEEYGKNYGLPGRIYGRNLTPSALSDWTDGDLLVAITTGVNKQGKPLFPLMPYRNYHQMRLDDAVAIVAYLRTLDPIANDVPTARVPAPIRLGLRLMPHRAVLRTDTTALSGVAYGRYLTQMAGCADCHTRRIMGKLVAKAPFAGGMAVQVTGGVVQSANITPEPETGIGRWTQQDFINRFKAYDPTHFIAPSVGDGFNTVMPWTLYAGMTETDLGAIYDYLRTVPPVKHQVIVFSATNNKQRTKTDRLSNPKSE
ncbi:cytochrome c-related protein [Fibrisoma limi BUZ 3]|uniref:Cytochrome c-related protein n=1 Tax=Fibrisoma limi BUZ 3 TaxID=1185876 RepID=I2GMU6_9BACT|nr:hypothetical protein [Fibrisoma limi]CCH55224.1 cytochrome c-related protein [Fibrisoma limi BUZ 3]